MASPYKRRKPSLVRNFWIYRRLVGLALVLGLLLWFIWANDAKVVVSFPFGLGKLESKSGLVILLSALVGSVATALIMTIAYAWNRVHSSNPKHPGDDDLSSLPDDRPALALNRHATRRANDSPAPSRPPRPARSTHVPFPTRASRRRLADFSLRVR
jgi:uncharacterized integral membrane protein